MKFNIPEFKLEHLYNEQTYVLLVEEGVYGKVIVRLPVNEDGNTNYDRPALYTGQINITVSNAQNQAMMVPLEFPIAADHPLEVFRKFRDHCKKAVEEFESKAFQRSLMNPNGVKQ